MAMVESTVGVVYDELIGSNKISLITKNVEFAQASEEKTLKRGTLLAVNESGEYVEVDSTSETASIKVAVAILKNDVVLSTTDKVVGTIYTSGMFNREAIILAQESDNIDNHEEELRDVGIYVTSIKGQDNAEALAVVDMARTDKSIVG